MEVGSPIKLLHREDQIKLPYLTKLQLSHDETAALPELDSPSKNHSLSSLALKENIKVNFYLDLLGKKEEEEEMRIAALREKERIEEEELTATYEKLYALGAPSEKYGKNILKKPSVRFTNVDMLDEDDDDSIGTRGKPRNASYALATDASSKKEKLAVLKVQREVVEDDDDEEDNMELYQKRRLAKSIAAELEHQINQLRKDPTKRAELEDRIERIKAQRMTKSDLKNVIEENKKIVREFAPDRSMQKTKQKGEKNNERMKQVIQKKAQIDEEYIDRKMKIINRKDIKEAERKKEEKIAEMKAALENRQRQWLTMIAFGARMNVLISRVKDERDRRTRYLAENEAAKQIQHVWGEHYNRVTARKWRKSMIIVYRTLRRWIIRWRVQRKRKAADMVYNFLTDLQDVNRIVQIIKRFRFLVTQSQIYWRQYKDIKEAQLELLHRQWDVVENELQKDIKMKYEAEQKKEDIMKNALNYTSIRIKKGKPNNNNTKPATRTRARKKQLNIPKVPEHIKNRILAENLRYRIREYSTKLAVYKIAMGKYLEEERANQAIEAARKQIAAAKEESLEIPLNKSNESLEIPKSLSLVASNKSVSSIPKSPKSSTSLSPKAPAPAPNARYTPPNSSQSKKRPPPRPTTSPAGPRQRETNTARQSLTQSMDSRSVARSGTSVTSRRSTRTPGKPGKPQHPGIFRILLSKEEMVALIIDGRHDSSNEIKGIVREEEDKLAQFSDNEDAESDHSDNSDDVDVADLESTLRSMTKKSTRPGKL